MTKKLYKIDSPVRNIVALQSAVNGEVHCLMTGLHWGGTLQGRFHWAQIFAGEKAMSKRSRRYLNALLNEAKRKR